MNKEELEFDNVVDGRELLSAINNRNENGANEDNEVEIDVDNEDDNETETGNEDDLPITEEEILEPVITSTIPGEKERKKKIRSIINELLFYVVLFVVCLFLVPRFVAQRTEVEGYSMNNTMNDGDQLIINKMSLLFSDPDRFDVIVFHPTYDALAGIGIYENQESEYFVKRVIGLPGETIQIKENQIYINGTLMEENYGNEGIHYAGIASDPVTLGSDEYFVMGDNRTANGSYDSRMESVGPIKRDSIVGKALLRIWPLDTFGFIN